MYHEDHSLCGRMQKTYLNAIEWDMAGITVKLAKEIAAEKAK